MPWAVRTRHWLDLLLSWPSETGSAGEQTLALKLQAELAHLPEFAAHPERLWRQPAWPGGPENLFALVRGPGSDTVILSGHYDTVSTRNYGPHMAISGQPEELRAALLADLAAEVTTNPDVRLALDDLSSGEFLPGRGALDMKGGLAAGLSVLEAWLALAPDERPGSLLLVYSPDEEDSSRGARAARPELVRAAREFGLNVTCGINLDASSDQGDGSDGRAIYLGTVGKLLPFVYMIGRDTHAGFPFEGISAHALSAELLLRLELNPALSDVAHGEVAPPPICLESRDFRPKYDVTTPRRVWSAFNLLSHRRTPGETLELMCRETLAAMETALDRQRAQAAQAGQPQPEVTPQVMTLGELREQVLAQGEEARQGYDALLHSLTQEENPLTASRRVTAWLADQAGLNGPLAVVGFGSLYYPHAHISEQGAPGERLRAAAEQVAASMQPPLRLRQYFAGISDMSFMGPALHPGALATAAAHLAAPTPIFHDDPAAQQLVYPTVNLGPWGRDYHQRLERVHLGYTVQELPEAVWRLAQAALRPGTPAEA